MAERLKVGDYIRFNGVSRITNVVEEKGKLLYVDVKDAQGYPWITISYGLAKKVSKKEGDAYFEEHAPKPKKKIILHYPLTKRQTFYESFILDDSRIKAYKNMFEFNVKKLEEQYEIVSVDFTPPGTDMRLEELP